MRIAQILLAPLSEYDKKSQRLDAATLSQEHETSTIEVVPGATFDRAKLHGFDLAHVYARTLPARIARAIPIRYVAAVAPASSRWPWLRPAMPAAIVAPGATSAATPSAVLHELLPEAVEEVYFEPLQSAPNSEPVVGFYAGARPLAEIVELTMARVHRTREEVVFHRFDGAPTPRDLAAVDLWVDFALAEDDLDGFVAEAIVTGSRVIATRTAANVQRLEKGRTGLLIPPGDPNEMTHAILTALFKPELSEVRRIAARQTASKFRSRQRARALLRLYERLIGSTP